MIASLLERIGPTATFPYEQELDLLREHFAHKGRGYFVEVGANDPQRWSQSWHLEQRGWTGVLIEPLPDLAGKLRQQRRAKVYEFACSSPENSGRRLTLQLAGIHSSLDADFFVAGSRSQGEIEVTARTLDDILIDAQAPTPIDFLSIDVEGHELEVLAGFDTARWRPQLILIEDLAKSLRIHHELRARGYRWVRRTGVNGWYVPQDASERAGLFGQWQFFRKHYLGTPFRHMREFKRKVRQRVWERLTGRVW